MVDFITTFPQIWILFCALIGSCFGSFASVVIYRTAYKEPGIFFGKSHCSITGKPLTALELIPIVSWLLQAGKSRQAGKPISPVYLYLELTFFLAYGLLAFFITYFQNIDEGLIYFGLASLVIFFGFVLIFYGFMFRRTERIFWFMFGGSVLLLLMFHVFI
jgi:prepilin signal peptidase PulO-like enzyme (type II secretory pathway)